MSTIFMESTRSLFEKISSSLIGNKDVKVIFSDSHPTSTDFKNIYINTKQIDKFEDVSEIEKYLIGLFLNYHETAHNLYTGTDTIEKMLKHYDHRVDKTISKHLLNILEDLRIELALVSEYGGLKKIRNFTNKLFYNKGKNIKKEKDSISEFFGCVWSYAFYQDLPEIKHEKIKEVLNKKEVKSKIIAAGYQKTSNDLIPIVNFLMNEIKDIRDNIKEDIERQEQMMKDLQELVEQLSSDQSLEEFENNADEGREPKESKAEAPTLSVKEDKEEQEKEEGSSDSSSKSSSENKEQEDKKEDKNASSSDSDLEEESEKNEESEKGKGSEETFEYSDSEESGSEGSSKESASELEDDEKSEQEGNQEGETLEAEKDLNSEESEGEGKGTGDSDASIEEKKKTKTPKKQQPEEDKSTGKGTTEKLSPEEQEFIKEKQKELEELKKKEEEERKKKEKEDKESEENKHEFGSIPFTEGIHDGVELLDFSPKLPEEIDEYEKERYRIIKSKVNPYIKDFTKSIRKVITFRKNNSKVRNKKSGKLDNRNLYKYKTDKTDLFYKKRKDLPDLTFMLLVDGSGSMSIYGNRDKRALEASVMFHEGLKTLKIKHALWSFATNMHRRRYDRAGYCDEAVNQRHINFEDSLKSRFDYGIMNYQGEGENRDGFSIRLAAEELKKQKEEKKIMFVISDGQPSHQNGNYRFYEGNRALDDTKKAIIEAERKGITLVGISIGNRHNHIDYLYKNKIKVNNLRLLNKKIENVLKRFILS